MTDFLGSSQETVDTGIESVNNKEVINHAHTGNDANRINPKDLKRVYFKTVTAVPSGQPQNFVDQIQIYVGAETVTYHDNPPLIIWDLVW